MATRCNGLGMASERDNPMQWRKPDGFKGYRWDLYLRGCYVGYVEKLVHVRTSKGPGYRAGVPRAYTPMLMGGRAALGTVHRTVERKTMRDAKQWVMGYVLEKELAVA